MTALHPRIVDARVIALQDSARVDGFLAQAGGENFRPFDAVDGRRGEGSEYFDRDGFFTLYGRDPLPGEIGCAVSHFKVLQEFAYSAGRDEDLVLVAEDDARWVEGALDIVSGIADSVIEAGMIVLANEIQIQLSLFARPVHRDGLTIYRVGHNWGNAWSMGLYLSSRAAARRYVDACEPGIGWVADHFSLFRRTMGIDVKVLQPSIVSWEGESSIRSAPTFGTRVGRRHWDRASAVKALQGAARGVGGTAAATARDIAWMTGIRDPRRVR